MYCVSEIHSKRGIPLLFLISSFYSFLDQCPHLSLCTVNPGQTVRMSQGVRASIRLLFYPLAMVKISLGVEGSVCHIHILLKKVTGHFDSSVEWPGVSSSFFILTHKMMVTSGCSLLTNGK